VTADEEVTAMVMTELKAARDCELRLRRHLGYHVSVVLAAGHPSGADVVVSGRLISVSRSSRTAWLVVDDGDVFLPVSAISSVEPELEAVPA
jgi:hypothetical protein